MSAAVIVIAIVFTFIFRFVGVVGPSMMETLHDGDWLAVSAYDAKPQYGQVVIITQPNDYNEPIVKRIIATENQVVDIDFGTGDVFVDGVKLDEPYINNPTTNSYDVQFPVTVPEGCVFVMGDNRQHSSDSRSSAIGFIDTRYILGQVKYKLVEKDTIADKMKYVSPKNWKVK
ncbi:MAG: signal peptidase I [Clostridia bacterium]|nr:signal peptidase I [Clostridia bacterium]